ncbi:MAG: hypothetical protein J3Q66DRAFT_20446 [Benniella sp.]|nr:MAG: hypothetical protein J3Q66DRAFT_20446 [Benniella sp.]
MPNQYYKKDIHRSMESLLNGLYVYQYLLDTSTFGLILRILVQDQFVSLKSSAATLRIAMYGIFFSNFLAVLRHLQAPSRYAVIIDFIGNVSIPSRSRLLWLDMVIIVLQIAMTLVSFNVLKADENSGSAASSTGRSSRRSRANDISSSRAARPPVASGSMARRGGLPGSSAGHTSTATTGTSSSSSRRLSTTPAVSLSNRSAEAESSSVLFDYTPQQPSHNARSGQQADMTAEYYVDDEEVRYSLDNHPSSRTQQSLRVPGGQGSSSGRDLTSTSEDEEEDDNPLGDDYEEILEQETFVLQVEFKDLVNYLTSGREALSFSRISHVRATGTTSTTADEATRVQNLPV